MTRFIHIAISSAVSVAGFLLGLAWSGVTLCR